MDVIDACRAQIAACVAFHEARCALSVAPRHPDGTVDWAAYRQLHRTYDEAKTAMIAATKAADEAQDGAFDDLMPTVEQAALF